MNSLTNILFGKNENIPSKFLEIETELSIALEDFLSKNKSEKLNDLIPKIKTILKKSFKEIEDDEILVYRGISLSANDFKKMFWSELNDNQKTLFYKIEDGLTDIKDYEEIKNYILKPRKGTFVQSWTSKKDIALSFAGSNTISVICVAKMKTPNLFFGEPGKLAKITKNSFPEEKETISVGPVKCLSVYFGPTVVNTGIQNKLGSKIYSTK